MFSSLISQFRGIGSKIRLVDDEKALARSLEELKKALLKNEVHFKVAKEIILSIEDFCKSRGEISRDNFNEGLRLALMEALSGSYGFTYAPIPPTVVLLTGLQGAGKTTSAAKLALHLKQRGKEVCLVACDLARLAAVEQLRQLSADIEVDFFSLESTSSPLEVAKEALKQHKQYDVLIFDTAGRLAIDANLMEELGALKKLLNPHEILYVADALSGQDLVRTASKFHEEVGLTGIILSKFDSDSKGGIALCVSRQLGVPIRFIGSGEKVHDFDPFLPERIVGRLMGAGDIATLVEKTSSVINPKEAKELSRKIKKGSFNFDDFLSQLENIKKMGSMSSILSMMPGFSGLGDALKGIDFENSKEIKVLKAMVSSMTKKERSDPDLLNGSRKLRIAKGAGLEVSDINRALKQFNEASKMAKKMGSMGKMGAGMGGLGGLGNAKSLSELSHMLRGSGKNKIR